MPMGPHLDLSLVQAAVAFHAPHGESAQSMGFCRHGPVLQSVKDSREGQGAPPWYGWMPMR